LLSQKTRKFYFLPGIAGNAFQDVPAWLAASLAAERITRTVIRGGRLGAGHGQPARMSESHAGTSWKISFGLRVLARLRNSSCSGTSWLNNYFDHFA